MVRPQASIGWGEMIGYEGIVTASVAKQIAETIRAAILEGRIKADERLPTEDELAQRYGVSRPTIREALKRLAAQNLIRSRRGPTGGNFVNRPTPGDLAESLSGAATLLVSLGEFSHQEIAAARLEFQGVCCRLAAANRTDEHLARMEEELRVQRDETITDVEFCASDVRFHRAIVDATGNGLISFVMYGVVEAMTPVTNMVVFRVRDRQEIVRRHEDLHNAIRDRDEQKAVFVLGELIGYLNVQYREALDRREHRTEAPLGKDAGKVVKA